MTFFEAWMSNINFPLLGLAALLLLAAGGLYVLERSSSERRYDSEISERLRWRYFEEGRQ